MHIVYYPKELEENSVVRLDPDESRHMVKVLRKKVGDNIGIVNGKGAWLEGEITIADPKSCIVRVNKVLEKNEIPQNYYHIAIAPPKNFNRFEWFLEKATELGVSEITPLLCKRSERKSINMERSEKKLINALKQSQGLFLPKINPLVDFDKFIGLTGDEKKFLATISEGTKSLLKVYNKGNEALVLIGPEGDFSPDEVDLAERKGFQPVSLGKNRLRVETAGIIALHTLILKNE